MEFKLKTEYEMQVKRLNLIFFISLLFSSLLFADSKDDIRLNQVGFYTYGPKTAVVVSPQTWYFYIKSTDLRTTYYRGELSATRYWSSSADSVKIADFSDFTREGTYVVYVAGIGASYNFTISSKVNYELSRALIRHFYYQRASTDLPSAYAGKWARPGGHFDKKIIIHPSAASVGRAAGEIYPSPKGWYDAGDYGKYIVNAGISTYELLLLYEQFSEYFDTLSLNIPESRNGIPDLLDEIKWELDWVLTMQDPTDGGVYHKLTGKTFIGDLMPNAAEEERYFIGKSITAAFDFAAICAVAYRIYKRHYPAFADSCLHAAKYAYQWGIKNPNALFRENPSDVVTGTYADSRSDDEYQWASWELYIATDSSVYRDSAVAKKISYDVPGWQNVGTLGMYSMALVKNDSFAVSKVYGIADNLLRIISSHSFRTTARNFYWGSNGNVANEGMALLVAFLLSKDCKYLEGAIHALDYLLGRNGPGYCFVTGFGTRSVMNPHHRPSIADGVVEPVPGFLAGGPNSNPTLDECVSAVYPKPSAKKWIDKHCSYSTNEIAINWNAPAAFLASGIEAVFNISKFDIQPLIDKYGDDFSPVVPGDIAISDILDDRVTLCWSSSEKASVSVQYSTDSLMGKYEIILCPGSDSNRVNITRLMPGKKYYVRISWIDNKGNVSSSKTSFTTASNDIVDAEGFKPVSNYVCGRELSFSFRNAAGINSRLIYSTGGASVQETLSCSESDGNYSTVIPGERVTQAGIIYSFLLQKDGKTLLTPKWSAGPDSIQLTNQVVSLKNTYSLVSLPAFFAPVSSITFLSSSIGDTSAWRYYGYDPENKVYKLFDTLRSGTGGWIFCKEKTEINLKGKGLSPDTLFPVVLRQGYNCVGNPFTFPVYWNNSIISRDSALIGIADSVSRKFIRKQIFLYEDNTANSKNDGHYITNRDLISNKYDDSIQLKPWEACWVYAEQDSVVLLLNPSAELNVKSGLAKKQKTNGVVWYYRMSAFTSGGGKKEALFGAASDAKDTYDDYDSPEPPPVSSEVQIGFLHPEWNNHKGLYLSDIKSCSGNHDWTLSVKSFVSGLVNLKWEGNGNHEGYMYLKDLISGEIIDMASEKSYSYKPQKGESTRNFTISWMPQKQSLNQLQFKNWNFLRERADFTKSLIKFIYSVPSSVQGRTVIEVFDINGRCVKRILDEKKEPGLYKISWDGKNNSGGIAANGFYVVRLFNSAYNHSIGVHLLR